jgi:protein O-mannosyl-transferase
VTLPFVLLLLDYWPLNRLKPGPLEIRNSKFLILEKLPFFVLALASSVVTFFAQQGGGAVVALEHFPLLPRLANALVSYVRYLGKTVFPTSLAVFYPYEGGWAFWQTGASIILLAAISAVSIWLVRRRQYLFVGWFWFLGMLMPVIGLVQVGAQSMADRYTYLPHIGIFFAIAWGLSELAARYSARAAVFGATMLVIAGAFIASLQVRHWRNTETLLAHAVSVTKGNAPAHYYLGVVLEMKGKTNDALAHFVQAVGYNARFTEAQCALGNILERQKNYGEATTAYLKALQTKPDYAPAHYGFANVLLKQAKKEEARNHYESAVRSQPDFAEAHYQLAVLLAAEKQTAEAIAHYKEAIRLKPDWLEPLNNLAWILATYPDEQLRDGKLAVELAERANAVSKNPGVLDTLAAAYAEASRFADAVKNAEEAKGLAAKTKDAAMVVEIGQRLELYKAQRPFRE